jgi:hypothetical protein
MSAGGRREAEDAYAPVEAPEAWPVLGLICFGLSLVSKPLVGLLPPDLRPYPLGVLLPVGVSFASALMGALLSWIGVRRSRGGALARLGLFVNLAVAGLCALAVVALVWIFRR